MIFMPALVQTRTDNPNIALKKLDEIRNSKRKPKTKAISRMDIAEEVFNLGLSHKKILKGLNE